MFFMQNIKIPFVIKIMCKTNGTQTITSDTFVVINVYRLILNCTSCIYNIYYVYD